MKRIFNLMTMQHLLDCFSFLPPFYCVSVVNHEAFLLSLFFLWHAVIEPHQERRAIFQECTLFQQISGRSTGRQVVRHLAKDRTVTHSFFQHKNGCWLRLEESSAATIVDD